MKHILDFRSGNKLITIEEEKLIILIDIVGFSKDTTKNQVYKIYLFQRYLMNQILRNQVASRGKIKILHFVPTGDGCYIVSDKCDRETALNLLISIIRGFKNVKLDGDVPMTLRASGLFGTVVPFFDMAHHLNYIGEGMNEASRILSGGQKSLEDYFLQNQASSEQKSAPASSEDIQKAKIFSRNSLYLGDSLAPSAKDFQNECSQVLYFPDVPDKHGIKRNITVLQGI